MIKVQNQDIYHRRPIKKKLHYANGEIVEGKVQTLCGQIFREAVQTYELNSVDCDHCCRIFDRQFEQLLF